jgi:hypothetical protein
MGGWLGPAQRRRDWLRLRAPRLTAFPPARAPAGRSLTPTFAAVAMFSEWPPSPFHAGPGGLHGLQHPPTLPATSPAAGQPSSRPCSCRMRRARPTCNCPVASAARAARCRRPSLARRTSRARPSRAPGPGCPPPPPPAAAPPSRQRALGWRALPAQGRQGAAQALRRDPGPVQVRQGEGEGARRRVGAVSRYRPRSWSEQQGRQAVRRPTLQRVNALLSASPARARPASCPAAGSAAGT